MSNTCTPSTLAEQQTFAQSCTLDRLFSNTYGLSNGYNMACEVSTVDAFASTLNGEFELDPPMLFSVMASVARTDPDAAALLLAASLPPSALPNNASNADASFDRLMATAKDSLIGGGNIGGNMAAATEAAVRAAWKRQAMNGFKALVSGARNTTIRLGPHISIEPRNIGRGGELRKGARLMVRIRGLPMTVVHSLPGPIIAKAGGQFGAIRVGATDLRRMGQSAAALADARVQSVRVLRTASSKFGGGVLAFGPSAALDLYDSAQWSDGALAVNWRGFAVRSAKSQSGNLVGFGVGVGAAAGAVALGVVAAVGWPVVLVGLGAGLVAQVAWGYFGADEAMARQAEKAMR